MLFRSSHPNLAANQLTGPVFAQAIVNAFAENVVQVAGITVTGAGGETTITSHGGTLQLSADVLPADATNKTVNWSIQNGTGQASISATGLVTAIANGTATATATAADGSGVSGSLLITISNQEIPTGLKYDDGEPISISMDQFELKVQLNDYNNNRKLCFYNLLGDLVITYPAESKTCVFNISSIPAGIYILVVSDNTNSRVFKIAKP